MICEGVVEGRLGQRLKGVIPLTNLNLVTQLTKMLDALLGPDELEDPQILECIFLQASRHFFFPGQFLADRTATPCDRLLASSCRPSIRASVCL